jgi:CRP-like cAMP-binding protein
VDWTLLSDVPDDVRRRVLAAARLRRFARGEVVFHEGDPGDTLHLISKGRVAVRTTTPLGDTATLAILGVGDFFGELALVSPGSSRSTSVAALEKTETFAVGREDFEELQREHPSVGRFLSAVLAAQIRRLTGQVLDALYVGADQRVLRRLAEVAEIYGSDGDAAIPLTQEDLATLAGTSRATVNRVLGEVQTEGIITVGRMRIHVLDGEKLARRAGR